MCFVVVTQVEQFVFSYFGGKIKDEVLQLLSTIC